MPQPQALSAQQANHRDDPSVVGESQPPSIQSVRVSSPPCTSTHSNQQWQQRPGVEQQVQQKQEQQQFHAQASLSTSGYSSLEPQINEGRSISCKDIQLVQNLIERCLQLYMNKGEVIHTLLSQAKIQSSFTSLVWQKLEEQNPDFFKAYYTRLKLKKQIMLFNKLLEEQADLMQKMRMLPKYSHVLVHQLSADYSTKLPTAISDERPSISVPPQNSAPPSKGFSIQDDYCKHHDGSQSNCLLEVNSDVLPSFQPSNPEILLDASLVATSTIRAGPIFPTCAIGQPTEIPALNVHPSSLPLDTSFSTHEPYSQSAHVTSDTDGNSVREAVGSLQHLPRNFSLSDLTAELGPNSDLGPFGSYLSPFLPSDASAFEFDDERILDFMFEHLRPDFRVLKE